MGVRQSPSSPRRPVPSERVMTFTTISRDNVIILQRIIKNTSKNYIKFKIMGASLKKLKH